MFPNLVTNDYKSHVVVNGVVTFWLISTSVGVKSLKLWKCGGLEACSQLPALKGVRGRVESSGIRLGRGTSYLVIRSCIQNQSTSWLVLIRDTLGVGISHGQPWTHLTHHNSNLGEATTFPHIVFSTSHCRTCIQMTLFPGTPKVESRNCPNLDSRDFGRS